MKRVLLGLVGALPAAFAAAALVTGEIQAQNPTSSTPGKPPAPVAAQATLDPYFLSPYPQAAAGDSAAIARGKKLFGVGCGFCHGSDARGGEGARIC